MSPKTKKLDRLTSFSMVDAVGIKLDATIGGYFCLAGGYVQAQQHVRDKGLRNKGIQTPDNDDGRSCVLAL